MSSEEEKSKARARARVYYYANRERVLERGRAWRANNKGWVKAYNEAYRAENHEREIGRNRAWKEANREGMNARRRAAYAADPDKARAYARDKKRASYARNPQKYRDLAHVERGRPGAKHREAISKKAWAERNRDRVKATARRWYQRNLAHARIQLAISQASRRQRRVLWANQKAIAVFYVEAALLTHSTGRVHVVDHIIPLKGRTVSGLHVENNLRIVERFENAKKSNNWESLGWERSSGDVAPALGNAPPKQLALF